MKCILHSRLQTQIYRQTYTWTCTYDSVLCTNGAFSIFSL